MNSPALVPQAGPEGRFADSRRSLAMAACTAIIPRNGEEQDRTRLAKAKFCIGLRAARQCFAVHDFEKLLDLREKPVSRCLCQIRTALIYDPMALIADSCLGYPIAEECEVVDAFASDSQSSRKRSYAHGIKGAQSASGHTRRHCSVPSATTK